VEEAINEDNSVVSLSQVTAVLYLFRRYFIIELHVITQLAEHWTTIFSLTAFAQV